MKAAIWLRVSTEEQETSNQLAQITTLANARSFEVFRVYDVQESAWRGAHQKALSEVYKDARAGRFHVLLIWSLDRLSREGVAATLEIVNRLAQYNVRVVSLQESWTEVEGPLQELLLSIVAWVAKMESERRSERTMAGLARARTEGQKLGRPRGSKDKRRRKKSGYFGRWSARRENGVAPG